MKKTTLAWFAGAALVAGPMISRAQEPAGQRAERFEVASVKPNRSGSASIQVDVPAPDRLTAVNIPLRSMIRLAFNVEETRIIGGPDWIASERFDIAAKADRVLPPWGPAGPPAALLTMLRTLLVERFHLVARRETRELPVYALVVAKDQSLGPALRRSTLDCGAPAATRPAPVPPAPDQPTCGMRVGPGQMVMGGVQLSQLAMVLTNFAGRAVIDRTGLSGEYDLRLSWLPERLSFSEPPPGAPPLPPADPNAPSLFAALQEQLGLRLDAQQTPLEVVVIDSAERPAPD